MQVGSLSAKRYIKKVLVRCVPVTLLVGIGVVSFGSDAGSSAHASPTAVMGQSIHSVSEWTASLVK